MNVRRNLKRWVCLVLSICMLFVLSVDALAAGEPECMELPTYEKYTVLGDSISTGFGLGNFQPRGGSGDIKDAERIPGSYADRVAEKLGIEGDAFHPCGHSAWRTTEFLAVMNGDESWPGLREEMLNVFYQGDIDFDTEPVWLRSAIADSDLITVNFGANDIFTYAILETLYDNIDHLPEMLKEKIATDHNTVGVLQLLCSMAQKCGWLGNVLTSFGKHLEEGTRSYIRNIPQVIRTIRECNRDADIVLLGVYNFLAMETGIPVEIVDLFDLHVARVNNYLNNLCSVRNEYLFCDITYAKNYGLISVDWLGMEWFWDLVKAVHPTENSHKYIAGRILDVLKKSTVSPTAKVSSGLLGKNAVTWNRVPGALRYRVYRSTSPCGRYAYIGLSLNCSFADLTAIRGVTYSYRVKAVMDLMGSTLTRASEPVSIRTLR